MPRKAERWIKTRFEVMTRIAGVNTARSERERYGSIGANKNHIEASSHVRKIVFPMMPRELRNRMGEILLRKLLPNADYLQDNNKMKGTQQKTGQTRQKKKKKITKTNRTEEA